jgi:sensor histidine kinase YesM
VAGVFIVYPRIIGLSAELSRLSMQSEIVEHLSFFVYRYLFFCLLMWILLTVNVRERSSRFFPTGLLKTAFITAVAYGMYVMISRLISKHVDCFTGLLLFQFVVTFLLCAFTGYVLSLYAEQREREMEIEQLKTENLQSRCEALASQINPHFFFNSLNSLSALVRCNKKEQTLEYINKLSDVFRYSLQSDKKGLVELREELDFLDSFRYLQEIRYADNLRFDINIPESKKNRLIPVFSLLPLTGNIVKHNMIDSENPMNVSVFVNDRDELVFSNPVHHKLDNMGERNGLGLSNLADRFELLLNKKIRIEDKDGVFTVFLPL